MLHFLILGEKCVFSAALIMSPLSTESRIFSGRVRGNRANNRECPTTELAATMSWSDELVNLRNEVEKHLTDVGVTTNKTVNSSKNTSKQPKLSSRPTALIFVKPGALL